jgi:hypothetical protein
VQQEVLKHGTNPTEYPHTKAPKGAFLAGSVKRLFDRAATAGTACKTQGARRTFNGCEPAMANSPNCRGVKSLETRHFYIKRTETDEDDKSVQFTEHYCLVSVGAADLAKSSLRCKVLFLNSCSSAGHYLRALRRRKKEAKARTVLYLTWRTAYMSLSRATNIFVEGVLKDGIDPAKRNGMTRLVKRMNGQTKKSRRLSGLIEAFK